MFDVLFQLLALFFFLLLSQLFKFLLPLISFPNLVLYVLMLLLPNLPMPGHLLLLELLDQLSWLTPIMTPSIGVNVVRLLQGLLRCGRIEQLVFDHAHLDPSSLIDVHELETRGVLIDGFDLLVIFVFAYGACVESFLNEVLH